jgi:AcrR family transcriptional regulator
MTVAASGHLDTPEALLCAAEMLIARHGVGAVSLRAISVAAGQRNNSAAQYHFGSKAGLVTALVNARLGPINARRAELLAAADACGRGHDADALVEALAVPLVEFSLNQRDGHYARFLAVSYSDPHWSEVALQSEHGKVFRDWRRRMEAGPLAQLPKPLRRLRVDRAVISVIAEVARWEAGRGIRGLRRDELVADLVMWTTAGILAAAPEAAAVDRLADVERALTSD